MEQLYTRYIQEWGKVERKGKKNPYTSLNGHMFSFIDRENEYLAVRLSKEGKATYNKENNLGDVIQYNSVMNGYVEIPKKIFAGKKAVFKLLDKSFEFVASLKPKPSKKKK